MRAWWGGGRHADHTLFATHSVDTSKISKFMELELSLLSKWLQGSTG